MTRRRCSRRVYWLLTALLFAVADAAAAACLSLEQRAELADIANADVDVSTGIQRERWETLIQAHQACGDVANEAAALGAWSEHAMRHLARDQALVIETQRYALTAKSGLEYQRAESASRLGRALDLRGELDLAERRLREASQLFERLHAWSEAADAQSQLARLKRNAGDYLAALAEEQIALALRRRIEPPPNVWRSLLNMAVLYEQLELFDDARRRYAEALDEADREGDEASIATVLTSFSGFLNDFGAKDAVQALAMAERALTLVRRAGNKLAMSSALLQVGRSQLNLGHYSDADAALQEGLRLAIETDQGAMQAHLLFRHGELAQLTGDLRLALERISAAQALYEARDNRHRLVKVHGALEQIHTQLGDPLRAAQSGRERFRLRDELIGAKATEKLGELLSRFELSEERRRSERLQQANAVAELTLLGERQQLRSSYLVAAGITLALVLLAWRHLTARRLYHLLHQRNQLVSAQAEQLQQANKQLTEQSARLYRASTTDALTGANNRAHGMQRLQELMQRPAGERRLAVVLIDIDHFKSINDKHGHPGGDQLLVAITRALQQAIPDGAELSRVGGEEFMVLLADVDSRQAFDIGNALRAHVRASTVDIAGQRVGVTISIGICLLDEATDATPHFAYAQADAALYRAKRSGRDCVCMQTPASEEPALVD
ncbi:MAG: diguanylate cyclase domain-containing protein [Pseudomarimonas sp.]